jgi:hypothetical protein
MKSNYEVISRLKFIGKIQKREKINVKYMYLQPDGIITQLSRALFYHDSRINTLNFLQETITKVFEIISLYENSLNNIEKTMCYNLVKDLIQSKAGLSNLKETYIGDIKFCCDMDIILQNIDAHIVDIDTKLFSVKEKDE